MTPPVLSKIFSPPKNLASPFSLPSSPIFNISVLATAVLLLCNLKIMNANINPTVKTASQFRMLAGLIIIATGVVLIVRNLNIIYLPNWLFDWYTVFIVAGIYMSAKSDFKNIAGIIFVFIGSLGMAAHLLPGVNVWSFMWPLVLIGTGAWFLLNSNKSIICREGRLEFKSNDSYKREFTSDNDPSSYAATGDDYIDNVNVLHSLKRTILSKDFKGGDIVTFLGNTKLNFKQADIKDTVILDITQTLSNTKITVPADWRVVIDVDAVFSDFDDKRLIKYGTEPGKILVLKGTSVLSKLEVKSA